MLYLFLSFFFFNDAATTEIYTLSLHDALPIFEVVFPPRAHIVELAGGAVVAALQLAPQHEAGAEAGPEDRKSTRLNSSHVRISYAVFCLKKKKKKTMHN